MTTAQTKITLTKQQQQFLNRYGPWAVVTGASSGIGKAIARRLAASGLNLVIVARNQKALEELGAALAAQYGVETKILSLDLSSTNSHEALSQATAKLDVGLLVASAGFGTSGAFLHSDIEQEAEMLAVNCRAMLYACHTFGERLAARGKGGMILLSSILAFQGTPYAAHYGATKAYVQTLAEGLSIELAPKGIDVLAAAPGPTETGFAARAEMKMSNAMNPADLAQPILDALGRKSTVLPGFLSKLLTYSLAPLPRWARIQIMGKVMSGMAKQS